jgi:HD-GYP domain-containing protein (c-di-GMP phosphodiesterase class II)
MQFATKEEFWFDLISPRLYSVLFYKGPLIDTEIDFIELENISKLFRDLIDFKSPFTATHSSGVAACAEIMAKLFGLSEIEIVGMKIAGNFHDLGKLVIPNSILEKPTALTRNEFQIMKSHTYHTINSIHGLNHIAEWAAFHHEKIDGSGYPFHRNRSNLTTGSRIMQISDIYTALAEDRPYRKGLAKEEIYNIMHKMTKEKLLDESIIQLLFDNYTTIDEYVNLKQTQAQEFYQNRLMKV